MSNELAPEMLTAKQRLFVAEYLKDFNGIKAAVRAGYSRRTARSIASENLTKPDIQNALARAVDERYARAEGDATLLLLQLVEEVDADIADLFDDAGGLKADGRVARRLAAGTGGQCRGGGPSCERGRLPTAHNLQDRVQRSSSASRTHRPPCRRGRLPEQGLAGSRAPIGRSRQAEWRQVDEAP